MDLCSALARWPQPDGWTLLGFVCTALGFVVGGIALVLTWLIYRWTNKSDDDKHAELLDALRTMGDAVRDLASKTTPQSTNLDKLTLAERAALQAQLKTDEIVVQLARSGSGKGNHPWQAATSLGRMLQIYTGGRAGGVHVRALD